MREELRPYAPLYARLAGDHFKTLRASTGQVKDYRSLLATVTQNDGNLIDAFFDHFIRGRDPATSHQFVAFLTQLLHIDLILTTNFDPLIETALWNEGLRPTVYEVARDGAVPSALLVRNQPISVVKLHGGTHAFRQRPQEPETDLAGNAISSGIALTPGFCDERDLLRIDVAIEIAKLILDPVAFDDSNETTLILENHSKDAWWLKSERSSKRRLISRQILDTVRDFLALRSTLRPYMMKPSPPISNDPFK